MDEAGGFRLSCFYSVLFLYIFCGFNLSYRAMVLMVVNILSDKIKNVLINECRHVAQFFVGLSISAARSEIVGSLVE